MTPLHPKGGGRERGRNRGWGVGKAEMLRVNGRQFRSRGSRQTGLPSTASLPRSGHQLGLVPAKVRSQGLSCGQLGQGLSIHVLPSQGAPERANRVWARTHNRAVRSGV